jgi:hypothetical protein
MNMMTYSRTKMIDIEFFPKVNDRSVHSVQGLDRLLIWSTTNSKLKADTHLYKQWLLENPNATKKEKSAMKVYYFPAVIFGGTFRGTGSKKDIDKISGLIVLDFDHIVNLTEIQNKIKADPYTYLLFISPSGDGLKAVVKHNLTDPQNWQYLYQELEAYYLRMFDGITDKGGKQLCPDPSGKDISRMCFLPYIENLYRNDDSDIWEYSGEYLKQAKTAKPQHDIKLNTEEITDALIKECYYLSAYLFENNINISENYEDWLSYGYSLCTLGEQGREIFHNISCISDKYDVDECDLQFDTMLNHFDTGRTSIKIYLNNAKRAIAHHAVFTKYGFLCA